MNGLAYFSTCATCGAEASRAGEEGGGQHRRLQHAHRAACAGGSTQGKYASPVVADSKRVYLTGRSYLYGLIDRDQAPRRAPPVAGQTR